MSATSDLPGGWPSNTTTASSRPSTTRSSLRSASPASRSLNPLRASDLVKEAGAWFGRRRGANAAASAHGWGGASDVAGDWVRGGMGASSSSGGDGGSGSALNYPPHERPRARRRTTALEQPHGTETTPVDAEPRNPLPPQLPSEAKGTEDGFPEIGEADHDADLREAIEDSRRDAEARQEISARESRELNEALAASKLDDPSYHHPNRGLLASHRYSSQRAEPESSSDNENTELSRTLRESERLFRQASLLSPMPPDYFTAATYSPAGGSRGNVLPAGAAPREEKDWVEEDRMLEIAIRLSLEERELQECNDLADTVAEAAPVLEQPAQERRLDEGRRRIPPVHQPVDHSTAGSRNKEAREDYSIRPPQKPRSANSTAASTSTPNLAATSDPRNLYSRTTLSTPALTAPEDTLEVPPPPARNPPALPRRLSREPPPPPKLPIRPLPPPPPIPARSNWRGAGKPPDPSTKAPQTVLVVPQSPEAYSPSTSAVGETAVLSEASPSSSHGSSDGPGGAGDSTEPATATPAKLASDFNRPNPTAGATVESFHTAPETSAPGRSGGLESYAGSSIPDQEQNARHLATMATEARPDQESATPDEDQTAGHTRTPDPPPPALVAFDTPIQQDHNADSSRGLAEDQSVTPELRSPSPIVPPAARSPTPPTYNLGSYDAQRSLSLISERTEPSTPGSGLAPAERSQPSSLEHTGVESWSLEPDLIASRDIPSEGSPGDENMPGSVRFVSGSPVLVPRSPPPASPGSAHGTVPLPLSPSSQTFTIGSSTIRGSPTRAPPTETPAAETAVGQGRGLAPQNSPAFGREVRFGFPAPCAVEHTCSEDGLSSQRAVPEVITLSKACDAAVDEGTGPVWAVDATTWSLLLRFLMWWGDTTLKASARDNTWLTGLSGRGVAMLSVEFRRDGDGKGAVRLLVRLVDPDEEAGTASDVSATTPPHAGVSRKKLVRRGKGKSRANRGDSRRTQHVHAGITVPNTLVLPSHLSQIAVTLFTLGQLAGIAVSTQAGKDATAGYKELRRLGGLIAGLAEEARVQPTPASPKDGDERLVHRLRDRLKRLKSNGGNAALGNNGPLAPAADGEPGPNTAAVVLTQNRAIAAAGTQMTGGDGGGLLGTRPTPNQGVLDAGEGGARSIDGDEIRWLPTLTRT